MPTPPQPQSGRPPLALFALVLFILAAGSGVAYLYMAESTPAWLSALIPSSRYAPSAEEAAAASRAAQEESGNAAPAARMEQAEPAQKTAQPPRRQRNASSEETLPPSALSAQPPTEAQNRRPLSEVLAKAEKDGPGAFSPGTATPAAEAASPSTEDKMQPPSGNAPEPAALPPVPRAAEPSGQANATVPEKTAPQEQPKRSDRRETAGNATAHPVIIYGKAKPVSPGSGVMRGSIPQGQAPAELGAQDDFPHAPRHASPRSGNEDSVVPLDFVQDLARFLASNFWPAGTHPMARDTAITTASLKWANIKYGAQLHGFNVKNASPEQARKRILNYAFTPAMLNGLYTLYGQRFMESLDREARSQLRGENNQALNNIQLAEMYELYADMAQGLAEAVRAYMRVPDARIMVAAYSTASLEANEAYKAFSASLQQEGGADLGSARAYQEAIMHREQRREELASAMRRNGAVRSLDADSLVYAAQWLYRRGSGQEEAFRTLASVLDSCGAKLGSIGGQYKTMDSPAGNGAQARQ